MRWIALLLVVAIWSLVALNGNPMPSGDELTDSSIPSHFLLWAGTGILGVIVALPFFWKRQQSEWHWRTAVAVLAIVVADAAWFTFLLREFQYRISVTPKPWLILSGLTYWLGSIGFFVLIFLIIVVLGKRGSRGDSESSAGGASSKEDYVK